MNALVTWKGIAPLRAQTNYFIGRDPSKWRTAVPNYARAEARRILPGVDLVAYSNGAADRRENQLEFDLRIAPQANADDLRIKISGAEELRLNAEGDLLMQVENAQLILHKPALYEEVRSRELPRKSAAAASPPATLPNRRRLSLRTRWLNRLPHRSPPPARRTGNRSLALDYVFHFSRRSRRRHRQ